MPEPLCQACGGSRSQTASRRPSNANASIAVYRDASLNELTLLPITIDTDTNTYAWSTTLRVAERFSLTAYDAAYLELAQRCSLPLATLNPDLRAPATALNISLAI